MKRILSLSMLVVMVAVCLTGCSGGGYTKPIDAAVQITFYGNSDYLDVAFPDEFKEWYEDRYSWAIFDEYCDDWDDEYFIEEFGKDYKVTYDVKEKEKVDAATFMLIKESLSETYDIPASDIKKAYVFDIEYTVKSSMNEYTDTDRNKYSVKIRNDWYLLDSYGSDFAFTCEIY